MAGSVDLKRLAKGLSEVAFRQRYGTGEPCREAPFAMRWGRGWRCQGCGHERHAALKQRAVLQCNRCKRQVSLTAGTIFHGTRLPLTIWFLAIHHLAQSKGGISSIELGRRLGVRQGTAWLMRHKPMQAMAEREAGKPRLGGRVGMDDACPGGQRSGGRRGRGAAGKTPFVAAVETTAERRPRRIRLKTVKGFRRKEVEKLARAGIAEGTSVVADGLSCRRAGRRSPGATPHSATSRQHWPAPTIMSARSTPSATSPASLGASIAATSSIPPPNASPGPASRQGRCPIASSSPDENYGYSGNLMPFPHRSTGSQLAIFRCQSIVSYSAADLWASRIIGPLIAGGRQLPRCFRRREF